MTWVTGTGGTEGAETVLTVALAPPATGTTLRLTHVGFPHEEARFANNEAWPHVLKHLDNWPKACRPPKMAIIRTH